VALLLREGRGRGGMGKGEGKGREREGKGKGVWPPNLYHRLTPLV